MSHGSPNIPLEVPLGKDVSYPKGYDASLLFPMPRIDARRTLGLASLLGEATTASALPFQGFDLWNAYELSWLNAKGLPKVALLRLKVPCTSPNIIESKSLKLYLNSFNQTRFETVHHVFDLLRKDLARASGAELELELVGPDQFANETIAEFVGVDLDKVDVEIDCYQPDAAILKLKDEVLNAAGSAEGAGAFDTVQVSAIMRSSIELAGTNAAGNVLDVVAKSGQSNSARASISETVFSRLLKSNCPVTDQPDWACIQIQYTGPAIDHASLLKYIVSYRMHNGFHEHCVEKIFVDILKQCAPTSLSVYARYTRRGGLDINPWRATFDIKPPVLGRSARQ